MTTRGERFGEYLRMQTGGRRGWQKSLCDASGVKRQTITKLTNPKYDGYGEMATISAIAEALKVRPWEIVAAMDGDEALPVDSLEEKMRRMMDAALDERLGPRRDTRGDARP